MPMSLIKDSIEQVKMVAPILLVIYTILLGLLFFVFIIGAQLDIPIARFTRDPAAIFDAHPFTGAISNIGILFWCSTAAVCFFTSVIHSKKGNIEIGKFLLFSGLLTSVLLLDDLFMFHEFMFPEILHIPQIVTYLGYLVLVSIYFIKFRSAIFRTEYIILLIACIFFGLSIFCDIFLPQRGIEFLVEDGFKLFGIVTWLIFFTRTCFTQTQKIVAS